MSSDHIKELNNSRPKQPFFFLKPASSLLIPNSGPILRPKGVSLHYEVELGLVIGKTIRNFDAADEQGAIDAIESNICFTNPFPAFCTQIGSITMDCKQLTSSATHLGYILAIDFTARNVQDEAKKKGLPWSIAKGFDTFCPISNIIPKSAIPNPQKVNIWLNVNKQVRQNDSTELMLFRIPRQLQDISRVMTLEKGDIVLTGTPKGVGTVVEGDVLTCGLSVDGKEIEEAKMEYTVESEGGPYEFKET
jgi:acylpyruvate hydrolase